MVEVAYISGLPFCGSVCVQTTLAWGTPDDVDREVRRRLDLFPTGGLFLGPTHAIQVGSPLENILALYETAGSLAENVDESILLARGGQRFSIEHTMGPLRDSEGVISSILIVFRDVSERRLASLQLTRQASHDPLTGLLNREAFALRVEAALRDLAEHRAPCAVCQIDLDQFSLVNNAIPCSFPE